MAQLGAPVEELVWVAIKAVLLYFTAVFCFRLGERRTLAQLSPFDFVAAVAVGSIVGRVPNAHDASYLAGAATLIAVLASHAAVTRLRLLPGVAGALDHAPRLLVVNGLVQAGELRRAGLTRGDLDSLLRQQGLADIAEARFVVLEQRGQVSIVRRQAGEVSGPLGVDTIPRG
jgi:uncharacterized membrane protein YcaP (DUF421 family)